MHAMVIGVEGRHNILLAPSPFHSCLIRVFAYLCLSKLVKRAESRAWVGEQPCVFHCQQQWPLRPQAAGPLVH